MAKFESDSYLIFGLLLIFVDDMFDEKYMAVLVELSHLICETETGLRSNILKNFTDDGCDFPLVCRRTCECKLLLQFIPLKLS